MHGAALDDARDVESAMHRKRTPSTPAANAQSQSISPTDSSSTRTTTSTAATFSDDDDDLDFDDDDLDAFLTDADLQEAIAAESERYAELRRKQQQLKKKRLVGGGGSWLQDCGAGLADLRSSYPSVLLAMCFLWLLATLCWLRWPLYIQLVVEPMEKALGPGANKKLKAEIEPQAVVMALVVPFATTGALFYWYEHALKRDDSALLAWNKSKMALWLRRQRRVHVGLGLDSVDVIAIALFTVVQVNCFVGKLLIDRYTGKLAKAGLLQRSARTFGMNGLYAMVSA